MNYISSEEAAEKWDVSLRQVQRLLAEGRVPCARKFGVAWMIPANAEKPSDPRRKRELSRQALSSDLARLIEATSLPMPGDHPDSILDLVKDERAALQYKAEIAYLRGDFAMAFRSYQATAGNPVARLRASLVGVAALVSLGDYAAYRELEAKLKYYMEFHRGSDLALFAELVLTSLAVAVAAPSLIPDWLRDGDFHAFPIQMNPSFLLYMRAKYLLYIGQYAAAQAVAQSALAFGLRGTGISFPEIYLQLICALSCHCLGHSDKASRLLLNAMRITLPHGFITPFAELLSDFGGLIEQALSQEFPQYLDRVTGQWQETVKHWISFHNQFAEDHITTILSLREYHLAQLVARRIPYAVIAGQFNISHGRLKNIMLEIYEKLGISNRDELGAYVLMLK